jgi:hypothetical protein
MYAMRVPRFNKQAAPRRQWSCNSAQPQRLAPDVWLELGYGRGKAGRAYDCPWWVDKVCVRACLSAGENEAANRGLTASIASGSKSNCVEEPVARRRITKKPDGNDSYHNDNQSASHRLSAPRTANAELSTQTLHAGAAKGATPKSKGTTGPNGLSKGASTPFPVLAELGHPPL